MSNPLDGTTQSMILHASAVAIDGRAVLIQGTSGSGKSALALEMMALGAALVADDRVILTRTSKGIALGAPEPIRGLIEARGVGLLRAQVADDAMLACIVDMDTQEAERLPPQRQDEILGHAVPLLHKVGASYFPAALVQYLQLGRSQ